jgi:hypothetical protein
MASLIPGFEYDIFISYRQKDNKYDGWVTRIKNDLFFSTIKDEPEFQKIVRDVEAKYQVEHEKVRKWLEEQNKKI